MPTKTSGFTLIELSIVLVIIGFIVGGILVGRDLITAATARKQISQIQQLDAVITTFRSKYNCLPGDCNQATSFLGAAFNGIAVADGDGDGVIRSRTGTGAPFSTGDCESGDISDEITQAFLHLNAAGLGNYKTDGTTDIINIGYPPNAIDSGTGIIISCLFNDDLAHQPPPLFTSWGNVIIVGNASNWATHGTTTRIRYVTGTNWGAQPGYDVIGIPIFYANYIDGKIDDGLPTSGKFGIVGAGPGCTSGSNSYILNENVCRIVVGIKITYN